MNEQRLFEMKNKKKKKYCIRLRFAVIDLHRLGSASAAAQLLLDWCCGAASARNGKKKITPKKMKLIERERWREKVNNIFYIWRWFMGFDGER